MMNIYLTNLGKYNEGELVGEWVQLPISNEELQKVFERIGINEVYEEYFITFILPKKFANTPLAISAMISPVKVNIAWLNTLLVVLFNEVNIPKKQIAIKNQAYTKATILPLWDFSIKISFSV